MTDKAKTTLKEYPKQDESVLQQMGDFYRKQYGEVWFVRCLQCMRVIAVEVPTASGNIPVRNRQIYGYEELFVTTRTRQDKTPDGKPMVGYECACGNDTRLGAIESGIWPSSTALARKGEIVVPAAPLKSLSPFEREQLRAKIEKKQSSGDVAVDYEINGNIERFETFQLERVA